MTKFLFGFSALASLLAGFLLIVGFMGANSAPQEAAVGALSCAIAVIPYVLARAFKEWSQ